MSLRSFPFLIAVCLMTFGCQKQTLVHCSADETLQSVDTVYFGADSPNGEVSDAQWEAFVDAEVTPRFPLGLTHWKASGQWRDDQSKQIIKELSRVLQIARSPDDEHTAKIIKIMDAYIEQFEQSSVLRVHHLSCMHIRDATP